MLVNCPNCGLSQPQDKYCAQCGVDMEKFRQKKESEKSIFQSPILQIGVVLVGAALAASLLYKQEQKSVRDRISYLKGKSPAAVSYSGQPIDGNPQDPNLAQTQNATSLDSSSNSNGQPILTTQGSNELPPTQPSSPPTSSAILLTNDGKPGDGKIADSKGPLKEISKTAPSSNTGSYTAHIYYTEINYRQLNQIFEESRGTGQYNSFGDYHAGILPQFDKKINLANPLVKIYHKIDRNFDVNKPLQWFIGMNPGDSENEIGFSSYLELTEAESSIYHGNIEIIRSWKESTDNRAAVTKNQYPASFEIAKGTGFFISGIMPRVFPPETDDALFSQDAFKILKSPPFKSKTSEFVIFIEITGP